MLFFSWNKSQKERNINKETKKKEPKENKKERQKVRKKEKNKMKVPRITENAWNCLKSPEIA